MIKSKTDKYIWILLFILLVERLLLFYELGPSYMSHSDDDAYISMGLFFARTGIISVDGYPGALTMPGMPVVIGLASLVFGDGTSLLIALKLVWIVMGVFTAFYTYKAVTVFCPWWAGLFAAAHFLIPNMAWMNHLILTETPYMLFFAMSIYYTFMMGERSENRDLVLYTLSVFFALVFRSNIIIMPLFTAAYVWFRKKDSARLLRGAVCFVSAMMLFIVPWTIRNYIQFGAFISTSYGAGDPMYLGTYQGEGFPDDSELDYENNVYSVLHEKYAGYYDENGNVKEPRHIDYLFMMERKLMAQYRMREWWKTNPWSMLKSYLLIKPRLMLNWSWAWREVYGVSWLTLHRISQVNMLFCVCTFVMSLLWKRHRFPVVFLTGLYVVSVYVYSLGYVTDRYTSTLLLPRYILAGFGIALVVELASTHMHRDLSSDCFE